MEFIVESWSTSSIAVIVREVRIIDSAISMINAAWIFLCRVRTITASRYSHRLWSICLYLLDIETCSVWYASKFGNPFFVRLLDFHRKSAEFDPCVYIMDRFLAKGPFYQRVVTPRTPPNKQLCLLSPESETGHDQKVLLQSRQIISEMFFETSNEELKNIL
ncbi:hypothetical protein RF11_01211 [Thelohanellus kitauei]|uniref:Uncharacterized protein n=1 Tax=Thelohanellus kitauei TaxID=669202 RepID=A0A0C2MFJ7_THEKT|nr:hypothetical protein RF11_01211 [Thelohanellus kitauei]